MIKLREAFSVITSFVLFIVFYGFCVGFLFYQLLANTAELSRADCLKYSIYVALITAPIVYAVVQIIDRKQNHKLSLQEKLRIEVIKFLESNNKENW